MTTEGKIIFDVLNEWVYNAQDQAGEKLIIVDASDFDKIIPEIEEKLKEVNPSNEKTESLILNAIREIKPIEAIDPTKPMTIPQFIQWSESLPDQAPTTGVKPSEDEKCLD